MLQGWILISHRLFFPFQEVRVDSKKSVFMLFIGVYDQTVPNSHSYTVCYLRDSTLGKKAHFLFRLSVLHGCEAVALS